MAMLYSLKVMQYTQVKMLKFILIDLYYTFQVAISPEISTQLNDCLKAMEYTAIDATGYGKEGSEPLSLMTHVNLDVLLPESRPSEAGVVSWSPPAPNWNPWTGANIDEGKLKTFI